MTTASWRFTLRDFFIILIIVGVAILFVFKLSTARDLDRPLSTFEIVLQGEAQYAFMRDQIQVGDKVYQKGSPVIFGVVTAVDAEPAVLDITDLMNGNYRRDVIAPNMYNIIVTIETRGQASLNGTPIIDNNLIMLNQYLVLNTNRVHLPTRVVSIINEG